MNATVINSLLLLLVGSAPLVEKVEINLPGRVSQVVPADVDGDGCNDLLVFWRQGYPPKSVGRISVFMAGAGRIEDSPLQVLSLPPGTTAYDVADADGDGRQDVLLLRGDGVWAFHGRKEGGLSDEAQPVIEVMTVARIPHEDNVPRMKLMARLGGDRFGMLLPTVPIGPLTLYARDDEGGWSLVRVLRVPTRSTLYTGAEDLRAVRDYSAHLQLVFPRWTVADQDGDGSGDLIFFARDRVAVFRARPGGAFMKMPDLDLNFGILEPGDRIKRGVMVRGTVGDVNGDGRADLLFYKTVGGIRNMQSELRLYRARADGKYPAEPDFTERRSGWGASAKLVDVDSDGQQDLVRPHVEMGLTALIGMMLAGKLEVAFEVYLSREGNFASRPDMSIESKLRIDFDSNQELTGPYPCLGTDFDGDGVPDLLVGRAGAGSGEDPDRLEIRKGLGGIRFSEESIWGTNLQGTRYVVPFQVKRGAAPSLLVYFPKIEARRGDVWVFHNSGKEN